MSDMKRRERCAGQEQQLWECLVVKVWFQFKELKDIKYGWDIKGGETVSRRGYQGEILQSSGNHSEEPRFCPEDPRGWRGA